MHVPVADGLVGRHLAIRLDAVLQTEKLPAPGPDQLHRSHAMGSRKCRLWKYENEFPWKLRGASHLLINLIATLDMCVFVKSMHDVSYFPDADELCGRLNSSHHRGVTPPINNDS